MPKEMKELSRFWKHKIVEDSFQDFISLNDQVWHVRLGDVFDKEDLLVLDDVFPHLEIHSFLDRDLSDFLTFLNLAVSSDFVGVFEKAKLAEELADGEETVSLEVDPVTAKQSLILICMNE